MRRNALAVLLPALTCAGACSVGKGVGAASGVIYEYGCTKSGGDYCASDGMCGTPDRMVPYDLAPSFFAGEPINDLRQQDKTSAIMENRLSIRLQHSGKQIELNDVLTFDVSNSYEVARCVRGRVDPNTNLPDWDQENCYRDPSGTGPGRLRVQHDSKVNASLLLMGTCAANLVANAVSGEVPLYYATAKKQEVLEGNWDSWVEFQEFGSASQAERPPRERDPISPKFLVDFGQRIYATTFKLTLVDSILVNAALKALPRPRPQIGGVLGGDPTTGRFDFDLQRGQGAQSFP